MGKRGNGEGSIYQDSRGLYRAAVTLDNGKRKYLSGRPAPKSPRSLMRALERKEEGLPFVRENVTVGAWLDHWLDTAIRPQYAATG